jgi:phosphoserine phosphatase
MDKMPSSQGPTDSRPIVFFDMDGVLTVQKSSWNYVHEKLGVNNYSNYTLFKNGKINYQEFLKRDLALWFQVKDQWDVEEIKEILDEIDLFPGAVEATQILMKEGFHLIIVSGGLMWLAQRVGEQTGIYEIYANQIFSMGGKVLPDGKAIVDPKRKDKIVNQLKEKYHPDFTISVGDSPDDEMMFISTDYSISMNNDPTFVNVRGFDLRTETLLNCSELILSIRDGLNETL